MRACFKIILTFYIIGTTLAHAGGFSKPQPTVNVGVESFRWTEFDASGQRLLRETGPRLALGFTLDRLLHGNLAKPYVLEARVYMGLVDYDGQTQGGVPAKTDSDYFGVSAEAMEGLRRGDNSRMDLLGGLGLDAWTRDIQNGVADNGSSVSGYREDYFTLYGKLGPGFLFQNGSGRSYLQFGIKYPFYTYEYVSLTSVGFDSDAVLRPGKRLSGYAKWRMSWDSETGKPRFGASFYYDSFRFSASRLGTVRAGNALIGVYQPESRMDVLGASLEYYF